MAAPHEGGCEAAQHRTIAEAMAYNAERRNMYRTATHPEVVLGLGSMTTPELVELREHTLDVLVKDMFVYDDELARRDDGQAPSISSD